MTLFDGEESVLPGLDRLVRWSKAIYARRRRLRENSCLRCGARAVQTCEACGARACENCWILSIETGAASALCLSCAAGSRASRANRSARSEGAELFRAGARVLAAILVAIAAVAYWQRGWSGPQRLAFVLIEPSILFALVPLAFLLGAIRAGILRLVRALVSEERPRAH